MISGHVEALQRILNPSKKVVDDLELLVLAQALIQNKLQHDFNRDFLVARKQLDLLEELVDALSYNTLLKSRIVPSFSNQTNVNDTKFYDLFIGCKNSPPHYILFLHPGSNNREPLACLAIKFKIVESGREHWYYLNHKDNNPLTTFKLYKLTQFQDPEDIQAIPIETPDHFYGSYDGKCLQRVRAHLANLIVKHSGRDFHGISDGHCLPERVFIRSSALKDCKQRSIQSSVYVYQLFFLQQPKKDQKKGSKGNEFVYEVQTTLHLRYNFNYLQSILLRILTTIIRICRGHLNALRVFRKNPEMILESSLEFSALVHYICQLAEKVISKQKKPISNDYITHYIRSKKILKMKFAIC